MPLYHRFDTLPSVYQQLVIGYGETKPGTSVSTTNSQYQCQEVSLWFPDENEELNNQGIHYIVGGKWSTKLSTGYANNGVGKTVGNCRGLFAKNRTYIHILNMTLGRL